MAIRNGDNPDFPSAGTKRKPLRLSQPPLTVGGMTTTALPPAPAAENAADLKKTYRWMLTARLLEDKIAALYRSGKIFGGVYRSKGQEAVSAALGSNLRQGDAFAPLIRDTAGRLAFGETMHEVLRTYLGSVKGLMRGREGNVHRGDLRKRLLPMISHLGAMTSVVTGTLIARRMKGETGMVGATCIGDGGTSTGSFHEGLNMAAVEQAPLVVVVVNNQYAYSTPTSAQFACRDLVDRAVGYGVRGYTVDGTDFAACHQVMKEAVGRAREGGGPQMVVATLLRLTGHAEHDDASYVSQELKGATIGRDCLALAEEYLIQQQLATSHQTAQWRAEISAQIERAASEVLPEPSPDADRETWQALASGLGATE